MQHIVCNIYLQILMLVLYLIKYPQFYHFLPQAYVLDEGHQREALAHLVVKHKILCLGFVSAP